jgi:hypothetical protein
VSDELTPEDEAWCAAFLKECAEKWIAEDPDLADTQDEATP